MKQFKTVLFALSVIAVIGVLTTTPARRSQASIPPATINPYPHPHYLPDLVVSEVDPVYTNSYRQYIGQLVPDQVWVKITNQGAGAAGAFECNFEWDLGYANEQEFFWMQNGLGAGQSVWVQASSNGYNLWAANHHFRFTVNSDQGIPETDYSNNYYDGP